MTGFTDTHSQSSHSSTLNEHSRKIVTPQWDSSQLANPLESDLQMTKASTRA